MRYLKALIALLFMTVATQAFAGEPVARFYLAGNGVWYGGNLDLPGDFEVGATGVASLSPHLSLVGGAFYGLGESYLIGNFGGRVTVSDVDNPDFSIGVGAFYRASSRESVRPQEWNAETSLGWRPYPQTMPRIILVGQGGYGFSSNQVFALAGVRYDLGGQERRGVNP